MLFRSASVETTRTSTTEVDVRNLGVTTLATTADVKMSLLMEADMEVADKRKALMVVGMVDSLSAAAALSVMGAEREGGTKRLRFRTPADLRGRGKKHDDSDDEKKHRRKKSNDSNDGGGYRKKKNDDSDDEKKYRRKKHDSDDDDNNYRRKRSGSRERRYR